MALPNAKIFDPFRGKPIRRLQREVYQRWYDYPHRNLLILGQQKSGSTWLFDMVCEIPGYLPWTPNYIKFGHHDLHEDWVERVVPGYTATKTHTRPTEENVRLIRGTGRPYVVLFRDLRDIAVSWCFYVGNERNHLQHEIVEPMTIDERLDYFIAEILPEFVWWATTWQRICDPELGMIVHYEELLADTAEVMGRVLSHFGVEARQALVEEIVSKHRFERETGRQRGEEDSKQFRRKGIAGDWRNYFSARHGEAFARTAGEALGTLGYDANMEVEAG